MHAIISAAPPLADVLSTLRSQQLVWASIEVIPAWCLLRMPCCFRQVLGALPSAHVASALTSGDEDGDPVFGRLKWLHEWTDKVQ
jgi:hypothetical protein